MLYTCGGAPASLMRSVMPWFCNHFDGVCLHPPPETHHQQSAASAKQVWVLTRRCTQGPDVKGCHTERDSAPPVSPLSSREGLPSNGSWLSSFSELRPSLSRNTAKNSPIADECNAESSRGIEDYRQQVDDETAHTAWRVRLPSYGTIERG